MAKCTTPECGTDFSKPGSVRYLSGDSLDCHINPDGEIIFDAEGECDSRIECARCGKDISELVKSNRIWDR